MLVFLPGAAEIRDSLQSCVSVAQQHCARLLPLHGDLAPEDQDAAVAPSTVRKVICSTNVAESSVTIEGVSAVVDSGLARVATHSPWTGIARLDLTRISRSSCNQRAGRAGRTGPGIAVRLYTEEDFRRRPENLTVEIARTDLARTTLQLAGRKLAPEDLAWLHVPPPDALAQARRLLKDLEITNEFGVLTALGQLAETAPVHPRLATLVIRAAELGNTEEACTLAAILSTGRPRLPQTAGSKFHSGIEALLLATQLSNTARAARRQLLDLAQRVPSRRVDEHALEKAILLAFPDRVMRMRSQTWLLANGVSAQLDRASITSSEFAVALEVDERSGLQSPLVRIASPIEPSWLLDLFPESVESTGNLVWNRNDDRVERSEQLLYRKLVIEESLSRPPPGPEVERILLEKALDLGVESWKSQAEVARFLARVDFAAMHFIEFPAANKLLEDALHRLAENAVSLAELRAGEKNGALLACLQSAVDTRLLDEIAPAFFTLPNGRRARVEYSPGKSPSVASRLQDFIGLKMSPSVARGQVSLLLELLAPNGRPVQVTADLPSFWRNLYPQLRKELSRRYPRHSWPEPPN